MFDLDDVRSIGRLDSKGMLDLIQEVPQQCASAWAMARQADLPAGLSDCASVNVLGMGGSAIGGALVEALVSPECAVPILSVGGYDLPAHIGPDDLVVASSYSGNTEETLSAFMQAVERGCRIIVITTGGRLAELAQERDIPLLKFSYRAPPRAALGYSFTLLLGLVCRVGLVADCGAGLEEAMLVMSDRQRELAPDVPAVRNPAKRLAQDLWGRIPVVYGAGFLSPVARRWKGQFNENSKSWAYWEELPELNHNAVVAYERGKDVSESIAVLALRSNLDSDRLQARWDVTQELLTREGVLVKEVWGRGDSRLAQMLSVIHMGDYVSFYLAMLNGADPTPVSSIDYLKERLAQI